MLIYVYLFLNKYQQLYNNLCNIAKNCKKRKIMNGLLNNIVHENDDAWILWMMMMVMIDIYDT